MERWNGIVEWNSGMTAPIEQSLLDDLYPIYDRGQRYCMSTLGDQSVVIKCAGMFPSVKVDEVIGYNPSVRIKQHDT